MKPYIAPTTTAILVIVKRPAQVNLIVHEPEVRYVFTKNRKQELAEQFPFKKKGFRKHVK